MTRSFEHLCAWYSSGGYDYPDPLPPPQQPKKEPEKKPPPPRPPAPGKKARHALVIGRFAPPHRGHQLLVDAARAMSERVSVVVRVSDEGDLPGALRLGWVREAFAGCEVHALDAPPAPGSPRELAFWQHWAVAVRAIVPDADLLVAGEREAWRLADMLGAQFALIDPAREAVPISGTEIRRDPRAAWSYLVPPARAHYARRVSIVGPESSGKSTLARALAARLDTVHVPEHARTVAARRGGTLREADLEVIARGQIALEDALARQCNRVLVMDTDLLQLRLWAERLFGAAPAWLVEQAAARRPDLVLCTGDELPFVGDATHDQPHARAAFARACAAAAPEAVRVHGTVEERVAQAVAAIG